MNSELLNNLRKAHMGNYGIILSLLGCLEHGLKAKKLVDRVIDSCAFFGVMILATKQGF